MSIIDFDQHDAWIFWTIPTNEEGADLRGIISAADAINHAIPSRAQIESSINRGLRAGLLEKHGERIRFAPTYRTEVEEACSGNRAWSKQWDSIYSFLTSREWRTVAVETYQLDKDVYDATVAGYIRTF